MRLKLKKEKESYVEHVDKDKVSSPDQQLML